MRIGLTVVSVLVCLQDSSSITTSSPPESTVQVEWPILAAVTVHLEPRHEPLDR